MKQTCRSACILEQSRDGCVVNPSEEFGYWIEQKSTELRDASPNTIDVSSANASYAGGNRNVPRSLARIYIRLLLHRDPVTMMLTNCFTLGWVQSIESRISAMTLCPIALVAGCKKCPAFSVCPLKGVIGDYRKEEETPTKHPADEKDKK